MVHVGEGKLGKINPLHTAWPIPIFQNNRALLTNLASYLCFILDYLGNFPPILRPALRGRIMPTLRSGPHAAPGIALASASIAGRVKEGSGAAGENALEGTILP